MTDPERTPTTIRTDLADRVQMIQSVLTMLEGTPFNLERVIDDAVETYVNAIAEGMDEILPD